MNSATRGDRFQVGSKVEVLDQAWFDYLARCPRYGHILRPAQARLCGSYPTVASFRYDDRAAATVYRMVDDEFEWPDQVLEEIYASRFAPGENVRILERDALEHFRATWKYHHPLEPEQLDYAGRTATFKAPGFYHGGAVMCSLVDAPGIWHQRLIEPA